MALIEVKNAIKTYQTGEDSFNALNDVSLTIEQGEFVAIMGASGSGKSTFMNMLGTLDKPNSGSYFLDGIDMLSLVKEFDLPYDIICRTNDVAKCFEHAFRNYDIKTVRNLISNKEIINRLKEDRNSLFNQTSGSVIYDSIFNFKSFDYIDLIYENGYSLMDIISKSYLNDLLNSLSYEINNYYRQFGRLPNEKDYNDFANGSVRFNERQTFLLFFFKVFGVGVSRVGETGEVVSPISMEQRAPRRVIPLRSEESTAGARAANDYDRVILSEPTKASRRIPTEARSRGREKTMPAATIHKGNPAARILRVACSARG
jgi:energy-coupling factor transporter ATP-binding protein EcfA2